VDKAPDAYRTISEVAEDLDLPQHVLRFWETRFSQIKPLKRGGGRRYYRPEDIDLLKGIRHLLYGEGYTIRGVQRIIKESGVKAIQALGRGEGNLALPKPGGPEVVAQKRDEAGQGGLRASLKGLIPGLRDDTPDEDEETDERPEPYFDAVEDDHVEADDFDGGAEEVAPVPPRAAQEPPFERPVPPVETRPAAHSTEPWAPAGSGPRPAAAPKQPEPRPPQLGASDMRRLETALRDLSECRKRLDEAYGKR
jgi:DNA-binding transcriptional MerR regulator